MNLQIREVSTTWEFQQLTTQMVMWNEGICFQNPNDHYPWSFFWISMEQWGNYNNLGLIVAKYDTIFLITLHFLPYVARSMVNLHSLLLHSPDLALCALCRFRKGLMPCDGRRISDIIMVQTCGTKHPIVKQCSSWNDSKSDSLSGIFKRKGHNWLLGSNNSN